MLLSKILHNIAVVGTYPKDLDITSVELNSKIIKEGGLFIALSGNNTDGKKYIPDAIKNGAKAIVYDGDYLIESNDVVFVQLQGDMRENVAKIAQNFYPLQPKYVSAITGTNGKTSIADFTRQMMKKLRYNAASIGTLGIVSDVMENLETLTTPDSLTMHRLLSEMASKGVDYVSLEASSIGIEQYRLDGLKIEVSGFTNFTQDHLDYHQNMQNYLHAKELLFTRVMEKNGIAVLNADILEFAELKKLCQLRGLKVYSYGYNGKELKLISRKTHGNGQSLLLELFGKNYEIELPLIGEFQAYNALCALGMVSALVGFSEKLLTYIQEIKGAKGRLDLVGNLPNGASVYVDYAHTPDALENVLKTMRHHTQNNLWVLFGCGGNRDALKRPIMGQIANDLADKIVVTDDNPRYEEADKIREQIMVKCSNAYNIGDRLKAIDFAVSQLQAGDMLVLAGKGHEEGQKLGDIIIPMNDIDEAAKCLIKYAK